MVLAAERDGILIPGKSVIIEPTSGNTGMSDCSIGPSGYRVIITMPNRMSQEKEALLRALGAEVVRTPDDAPWDSPASHIGRAFHKRPGAPLFWITTLIRLVQVNNPLAHEYTTGPEIIAAVASTPSTSAKPSSLKVDVFVAGAGTGGTITGVSHALKKDHNPECIVIGVDPVRIHFDHTASPPLTLVDRLAALLLRVDILMTNAPNPTLSRALAMTSCPNVLSHNPADIDHWVKTSDNDAFQAVERLMKTEGLLVGGSSGSALSGALAWLKTEQGQKIAQTEGLNVVILLADGIRNYMSKEWFLDFALRPGTSRIPQTTSDTGN
ncbi:pyridoxal phosphate-dependent enzyme beta subunit [Pisolithus orientalis]|uniref:pyridoxal phosphate-dependent enzyme beta subunit n=1 Tax=Pisolithus orientalis TaxID=936130 RepID=UPI0022246CB5|nr:pyridoxal phosphate-dependent enzyme beta subunit [Pisolithus orientalis]KAI5999345.1 pyridoxal phosphate-dependent enzyme beta subunit [Pisolithus orientalis]